MRISIGLFLGLTFFSTEKISEVDYFVVQRPIAITLSRFSPAFAALEDNLENQKLNPSQVLYGFSDDVITINSGEDKINTVSLASLKIKRPVNVTVANLGQRISESAKDIIKNSFQNDISITDSGLNVQLNQNLVNSVVKNSSRLTNQNVRSKQIDVDGVSFEIGTSSDFADKKPMKLAAESEVSNFGLPLEGMQNGLSSILLNQTVGPLSIQTQRSESPETSQVQNRKAVPIKGNIILADGAVYPGDSFQFYLQRVVGQTIHDRGFIDPSTGDFKIDVKDLSGSLNVELRHDDGALIAFGSLKLNKNSIGNDNLIKVIPTQQIAFLGQALSYESFDQYDVSLNDKSEVYIDGDEEIQITDISGKYKQGRLASGSQVLISAAHKGYWNSLQIAELGQPVKSILHSDKHMASFLKLIEPYLKNPQITSVIWGRVLNEGQPLKNIKVSLHGFEDIQPLYFDYRIPNPNLEATSEDGFFAFINPPEGLHIIKTNNSNLPSETAVVRLDHTSLVHIEAAPKKNVNVRSFSAFDDQVQVPSKVSIPGSDNSWKVGPQFDLSIPFFDTPTNMVMDVEPFDTEYIKTRYFMGRRRSSLFLPQFKKEWLSAVLASQKVNQIPRTTTVIGWVEKGSYEVQVFPRNSQTRIVYFDKLGLVTDSMVEGGGYIATNVPQGVVTSTLRDKKTGDLLRRLSIAESHVISVNYITNY